MLFFEKNDWYLFFLVHIKIPLLLPLINWWNKVFTWYFCRFAAARAKILWGSLKRSAISGGFQLWPWAEFFTSFLRFCGSSLVSLEVFPQHKSCWLCRQLLYVTLFFISPLFQCLFNLEFQNLLLSVYPLYFLISLIVFCSNLLSFFSSFPVAVFCLLLPYALFLFNLFSFY